MCRPGRTKRASQVSNLRGALTTLERQLSGSRVLLLEEGTGLVRVDRDPRGHRRGEGHLPEVTALGRGRLEPDDLIQRGRVVLQQLGLGEGRLADDEVEVPVPVGAE